MSSLSERFGPPPAKAIPVLAAHEWLTMCYWDMCSPIWNPMSSSCGSASRTPASTRCGLGSPEALAAMRSNDACLGRILDAVETRGVPTTVIVASDHGHNTVTGMVRADHALQSAGFGAALADGRVHLSDLMVLVEDGPGAATLRSAIGAWLREQPWVGAFIDWSGERATDGLLTPAPSGTAAPPPSPTHRRSCIPTAGRTRRTSMASPGPHSRGTRRRSRISSGCKAPSSG